MKHSFPLCIALLLLGLVSACELKDEGLTNADEYDSVFVQDWMDMCLKLTKETTGFTPPVAARMFGYVGLTLYEAVQPGIPGGISLAGQVTDLKAVDLPQIEPGAEYHWGLVGNAALGQVVKSYYESASANNLFAAKSLEQKYEELNRTKVSDAVLKRSIEYGRAVAAAMVSYANSDGQQFCYQSNFPPSYMPPTGDGLWVPTPQAFQKNPLQPYWGKVRTFYPNHADGSKVAAPLAFSSNKTALFYQQALEVLTTANNLTAAQKAIAQYWNDETGITFTPPGHSISIARQVLAKEKANLSRAAEIFAKVGMGVHDAMVSCWNAKYKHNLLRPVSFINQVIDPNWKPLLTTPVYPDYPSEHAAQSAATAQILADLFGSNYAFSDNTHQDRKDIDGRPRSFKNFFEMANEASISRLYGGIHYRMSNEQGLGQGTQIGKNIGKLNFKK